MKRSIKRRDVLAASGVALTATSGCLGLFCGDADSIDESDVGRSVSRRGEVVSKAADGSRISLSGGVSADVGGGNTQDYVANQIDTGDCVTVEGEVADRGSGPRIVGADVS